MPIPPDDEDLSSRLKKLDATLDAKDERERREEATQRKSARDTGAVGQAFRYSAEFIAGPLAGSLLGYGIDKLFGTSPFGLIICLILGFCAGMLNLMRAAGLVKPPRA